MSLAGPRPARPDESEKYTEHGRDPEAELRAAARRYRDVVRDWERP